MTESTDARSRFSFKKLLLVSALFILGAFLFVTFVPIGGKADSPGVSSKFHVGKIEAKNDASLLASVSGSARAPLDLRTIAIVNRSDHPVMRAVTQELVKSVSELAFVESVRLYEFEGKNVFFEVGEPLPAVLITLDMPRFDEAGLLATGRTVDATIKATVGQNFWNSRYSYMDHLTPPTVRADADVTIDHHSVSTGYETAGAKYTQLIENLAAEVDKQIAGQLVDWAGKYELAGDEPEGLMPAYRPVPDDLPLPTDPSLTMLITGTRLMAYNHTVWTLETQDDVAVLTELKQGLEEAGWRVSPGGQDSDGQFHHIRGSTSESAKVLKAFRVRPGWQQKTTTEPDTVVIRYTHRMTRQEMDPVFERMLEDENEDPLALLRFGRAMESDLSKRVTEKLMSRNCLPLEAEKRVIRELVSRGELEAAEARLGEAYLKAAFAEDDQRKEIVKLAEEVMGNMRWQPPVPTEADIQAIGGKPIVVGEAVTSEVGPGESAIFYQWFPVKNDWIVLNARVDRATIAEGTYKLSMSQRWAITDAGRGSTSTTPHHPESPWNTTLSMIEADVAWLVRATEVSPERFKVKIEVTPVKRSEDD